MKLKKDKWYLVNYAGSIRNNFRIYSGDVVPEKVQAYLENPNGVKEGETYLFLRLNRFMDIIIHEYNTEEQAKQWIQDFKRALCEE